MIGAHGVQGLLRVKLFTVDPAGLLQAGRLRLARPDGAVSDHRLEGLEPGARGQFRMALADCRHRDQAEALHGATIWVRRADLPPLSEAEFYLADTLGCVAQTPAGEPLGTVVEVGDNGAQALLHLQREDRRYNVPAVPEFIVDFDGQRLVLDLPDGLLEAVSEPLARKP